MNDGQLVRVLDRGQPPLRQAPGEARVAPRRRQCRSDPLSFPWLSNLVGVHALLAARRLLVGGSVLQAHAVPLRPDHGPVGQVQDQSRAGQEVELV